MNKIECINLCKSYFIDSNEIEVLKGINLTISRGDLVAISGKSGAGKSTLLQIIASLDSQSSGSLFYDDKDSTTFKNNDLSKIRLNNFGFVYQFHHLLEDLNVLENILIPLEISNKSSDNSVVLDIIEEVGLTSRINHLPWKLSGGEKQRVAIARALVNKPSIIFADEPTGNLDSQTGDDVMNLFKELNSQGQTIILITHEEDIAKQSKRIINIKDGLIESDLNI